MNKITINNDEQILLLQKKFIKIKEMGYIKSVRNGSTGIGMTFEKLIGKQIDNASNPDFFDIEIKTKRKYSVSNINLININPKGPTNQEINRLKNTYGYNDKKDPNLKKLNAIINGKKIEKCGAGFLFKLKVDRKQKKIFICILDNDLNLIEKRLYWDFEIIKERIYKKINILALVYALTNKKNGVEYFKYYKMNIYILKDFNNFIRLIENGKIKVALKLGNYYTKERYGMTNSHGISFIIDDKDILELFDIYK